MSNFTLDPGTLPPEAVRAREALGKLRWSLKDCHDAVTDPEAPNAWNIDWRTFKRMMAGKVPVDPNLLSWLENLAGSEAAAGIARSFEQVEAAQRKVDAARQKIEEENQRFRKRIARSLPKRADIYARVERRVPSGGAEIVLDRRHNRPVVDLTRDE